MVTPRERMVISTALLIRERGAHSTAISDVLEHSGAPRGSAYHYFPGGRTQLLCEAVDYAADFTADRMATATDSLGAVDVVFEGFRSQLLKTDYRAGCPVVAVAVEADNQPVLDRAAAAFARWTALIEQRLKTDGVPAERAEEIAMLAMASIEGALVVARTARDVRPLDLVHRQLRAIVAAAISLDDDHGRTSP
ncbi:TetR/AcrR family transcriptional regulator [Mycolicibacterium sediminis]|uniref:TetR family transcriptional regulator n=1 Tax=Mycolicibacterium sediminis TaxID=1286180 RepID=A0A7I7QV51_9MYCO|nr:TetR/AcrR family transcriptional regulator [Mycolicibacterium sediminis]BBY30194.1 TetR family transcriptional regulator [Mycolicibacterium sediminis]